MSDENPLVLPEDWLAELHPRRGGLPVPGVRIGHDVLQSAAALTAKAMPEVEKRLPDGDPELSERARAHLAGTPDPVGAAVVAAVAATLRFDGRMARVMQAWTVEHGLPFAVCAYAELNDIWPGHRPHRRGRDDARLRRTGIDDHRLWSWWAREKVARPLRVLMAAASEQEYRAAVDRLAEHRATPAQRVVAAYLVPSRQDWVDDACAAPLAEGTWEECGWMLLSSLGSAAQLALLGDRALPDWYGWPRSVLGSLLEGLGPAALPVLTKALDRHPGAEEEAQHFQALALLPADDAFRAVLDRLGRKPARPALIEAARRAPARALRLLAATAAGSGKHAGTAADLLDAHLRDHPDLPVDELPDNVRTFVETLPARRTRVPEAPPEALPPLLVEPPWTRRRVKTEPIVVAGLTPPDGTELVWAPGERDVWTESRGPVYDPPDDVEWTELVAGYREGRLSLWERETVLVDGPADLVRPLLTSDVEHPVYSARDWLRSVVARFGMDTLPLVLAFARERPGSQGHYLLPFRSAEIAVLMAGWLVRLKSARRTARKWFTRHGLATVPMLVPDAVGEPGARRRNAGEALRLLAAKHGNEAVVAGARPYGDQAAAAIATLLATDPLDVLPARMPRVPAWAEPRLLPQVVLRGRTGALPERETGHLLTMLALSRPDEPYPGVAIVAEACDPGSLTEFAWALFHQWETAGAPSKGSWALTALGPLGDDRVVRRLAPLIREWPGRSAHARAVAGTEVLARIGTDVALMHLHAISRRAKFHGLRGRAQEKIEEIAAGLGLSEDQLEDRLVPDFGLDAEGGMALDYGPRRFRVGFDEQLRPFVTTEDGKPRRTLPKPGAKDDPVLAPAAHALFAGLKKDVRAVAADQRQRLERSMTERRLWSVEEFRAYLVEHPLMWHFARRLVWLADGVPFRLAEDRSYADVEDDELPLPATARIAVAHPADLGDALPEWAKVLEDYEILQPFPQLDRPAFLLTAQERAGDRLTRFEGAGLPAVDLLRLLWRGWNDGSADGDGRQYAMSHQVDGGRVEITFGPGIKFGYLENNPDQTLGTLRLHGPGRFGDLPPAAVSELLLDLTTLTETP
ncbi:DUF4132 domain-containing protein [Actinomadura hibisca]|uniref:DUF4132 domain-containing protein n=1 Tax=Actinomadura hibisca TaxID=68565 RepID=UPI000831D007|nr:DUF4132 domain-containing protein [Actinomadura hibisca]